MKFLSPALAVCVTVTAMLAPLAMVSMVGVVASRGFVIAAQTSSAPENARMTWREFGKTTDGKVANLYTLQNKHGARVSITNYGGTIVSIQVPDRQGKFADVTHGYDDLAGYVTGTASFGGTIGRYANRIAHGEFALDGVKYTLA
ncbi:MAG TPA: hypothetical protein VKF79_06935, partial [Candidatus Acidoferrum sp.]|nr:hypothetical protein [Candidatus Acidoferrum sp.]